MAEFLGFAVVLGFAWLVLWIFYRGLILVLVAAEQLEKWIFHSDDPLPRRILAIPLWIPLALFYYSMLIFAVWGAITMAKSAKNWWEDGK